MRIVSLEQRPYRLQFQVPLRTARGPIATREGHILTLEDDSGRHGHGEICPWTGFGSHDEAVISAGLEAFNQRPESLLGTQFENPEQTRRWVADTDWPIEIRSAIETALLSLMAQRAERSLAGLLASEPADSVPVHTLVSDAEEAPLHAHAIKVKVGYDLESDVQRVKRIRARIGPQVPLRLDANGAWSFAEARNALPRFAEIGVEFVEQPLPRGPVEELVRLRELSPIPVAADESICDPGALEALLDARAIDVAVLKPAFLGGPLACYALAKQAQKRGLRTIVTHALGSVVERSAALHVAAALRCESPCGLGHPFGEDLGPAFQVVGGRAYLPKASGLGVRLDHERIKAS